MALIAEVCRKRVWLLLCDSSSNIQMVIFNLSDSLKLKTAQPSPPDPPAVITHGFFYFMLEPLLFHLQSHLSFF